MAEPETRYRALWNFCDSPFTWGEIGVVIGAALASPVWFRYAFIGGGISIGIGLLRANAFRQSRATARVVVNLVLCCSFVTLWILLWKVIPKPEAPVTRNELQQILNDKPSTLAAPVATENTSSGNKPISRSDLVAIIKQYSATHRGPSASAPTQTKFANITNTRLADMARAGAVSMRDVSHEWKAKRESAYNSLYDHIEGGRATDEERKTAPARIEAAQKEVDERYKPQAKRITLDANECRLEILIRLMPPQEVNVQDKDADALYRKIATSDDFSWTDLEGAGNYLDRLKERLQ
jgi:hypothetical protein